MCAVRATSPPQVSVVRNWYVSKRFSPSHFLDHTVYDCGGLTAAAVQKDAASKWVREY